MNDSSHDADEYIPDTPKDGLVTATGVILAFVLGFFVNYSAVDHPWRLLDSIPLGLLIIAILVLSLTLYRAFLPYRQSMDYFKRTVKLLMVGILLSLLGAIMGVIF